MWGPSGLHADVWQLVEATAQIEELTQNIYQLPHANEGALKGPLRWEWPPPRAERHRHFRTLRVWRLGKKRDL